MKSEEDAPPAETVEETATTRSTVSSEEVEGVKEGGLATN
jgi:hypothetical protein